MRKQEAKAGMSQYDRLEALIIESIRTNEPGGPLYGVNVVAEADKLEKATGRDGFRIIDTRIQALRKAGKIRHATKAEAQCSNGRLRPGWNIAPQDQA